MPQVIVAIAINKKKDLQLEYVVKRTSRQGNHNSYADRRFYPRTPYGIGYL